MNLHAFFLQLRVFVVTLLAGLAFCAMGVLTLHFGLSAARVNDANRELQSEIKGLVERVAEVEGALRSVESQRQTLDRLTLTAVQDVTARTSLDVEGDGKLYLASLTPKLATAAPAPAFIGPPRDMTAALSRIEQIKADARTLVRDLKISGEQAELRHEVLASIPSRPPAKGWLSSAFGVRQSPFHSGEKMHNGVDIAADVGTPVFATADGVVTFAGLNGGYGKYLRINHGFGISTRFAHSGELLVKKGQRIRRGDQIAVIGLTGRTTGPHVHYEVLIHDQPVDPEQFFIEATLAKEPAPLALAAASAPMGGDTDLPLEEAADAEHGWRSMGLAGERLLFASSLPGVLNRTTTTDVMFFAALLLMLTIASSLVRLGEPKVQPLAMTYAAPKRQPPSPYGLGLWATSEANDEDEEE